MYQDKDAVAKRHLDETTLAKLEEAYRSGWLHNVLSRITPLTLRRRDDYMAMADIFIKDKASAENVLDRFDADMELFCTIADITITKHMNSANVSEELRSHVDLYQDVNNLFSRKFGVEKRDPIQNLATSPFVLEEANPFVKEFVDKRFNR